jgi:hypothetical protein
MSWDSSLRPLLDFAMPLGLCATTNGINSSFKDPAVSEDYAGASSTFGSNHSGGAMFATADGATTRAGAMGGVCHAESTASICRRSSDSAPRR